MKSQMIKKNSKKNYRCIIIDDEKLARDLILLHLSQLCEFEVVASCESAIEAHQIISKEHIDLIFLDIEMPVLKGTDFYQNLVHKPSVIFTTAYRNYALDGFELNAVDYLLKPIVFSRFFKAIEKFKSFAQPNIDTQSNQIAGKKSHHESIFVRKDRKQIKVMLDQILYIQGLKDYIKIFLIEGSHIIKSSLSGFEQQLPDQFIRIHRSYIINLAKITAYTNHDIEIGENEIPIGENYKTKLNKKLS